LRRQNLVFRLAAFFSVALASCSSDGPSTPDVPEPSSNPPTSESNLFVFDPLTDGRSIGEAQGGDFRSDGWMATNAAAFIRYEIPPTADGFVEFQVKNLMNPNPRSDKRSLVSMWDPARGDFTVNPFRVNIAKYDTNLTDHGHLRLRFISNGQEYNTGINFHDWDPQRVYTFRMEWGALPGASAQRVDVSLDGEVVLSRNYEPPYLPDTHWVELGLAQREESLEQAIYSNVKIGRR